VRLSVSLYRPRQSVLRLEQNRIESDGHKRSMQPLRQGTGLEPNTADRQSQFVERRTGASILTSHTIIPVVPTMHALLSSIDTSFPHSVPLLFLL
jgi:hypothetical protein